MSRKKMIQLTIAGIIALQGNSAHAFDIGKAWNKVVDGAADVYTLGEHGRERDEERANADARYYQMLSQMQNQQLQQQISFLKDHLTTIFGYYCDDMGKLSKIHEIQVQTLRSVVAFNGALSYATKAANSGQAFKAISAGTMAQMNVLQKQLEDAFDPSSGKSILSLNDVITQLGQLARQNAEDSDALLTYMLSQMTGQESLTSNLTMLSLLISNIHQMVNGLEQDMLSQLQRSTSLSSSSSTQLFALNPSLKPLMKFNANFSGCTYEIYDTKKGPNTVSVSVIGFEVKIGNAVNPADTFAEARRTLIAYESGIQKANLVNKAINMAIVRKGIKPADLERIKILPRVIFTNFAMVMTNDYYGNLNPSQDLTPIMNKTAADLERNPFYAPTNFSDVLKKIGQSISQGIVNEDVFQATAAVLRFAVEHQEMKPESIIAYMLDIDKSANADGLAKLSAYAKQTLRYNTGMTQATYLYAAPAEAAYKAKK